MNSSVLEIITLVYLLSNSIRVLTYLPQIILVSKEVTSAKAMSLITWSSWVIANLSTGLYAHLIANDFKLAIMSYGNTACCTIVVGIVMYKRHKYGDGFNFLGVNRTQRKAKVADDEDVLRIFAK